MKIALGCDHAGFALKNIIMKYVVSLGHEPIDHGTDGHESCDYPDFAVSVSSAVSGGDCERGILICASGIGMSIAANRFPRVRAALVCSPELALLARLHNNANILCLGAKFIDVPSAKECVKIFLETPFEGGRHAARVCKIPDTELMKSAPAKYSAEESASGKSPGAKPGDKK